MAMPPPSLKGRALRYLAAREHSRAELLRKLAPHAQERSEIEQVLDDLQAKGFLSEERVAASVLRQRAARLGDRRLRQDVSAAIWQVLPPGCIPAAPGWAWRRVCWRAHCWQRCLACW